MKDHMDIDTGMKDDCGDENKKLVDKFLTAKVSPDKSIQNRHFGNMLEAFRKAGTEKGTESQELSDDEIDFIAAAGLGSTNYKSCPLCGKVLPEQRMDEHMYLVHKGTE